MVPIRHKILKAIFLCAIPLMAQDYKLVTPNPSTATQALANYMLSIYGKQILSGQMDEKHLDRIVEASGGKEPAMMGYDFYGIKPGVAHGDPAKAIKWAKEKGGIVTFSWHWSHPDGSGEFNKLNFDLPKALADTANGIGKAMVADLHAAATELGRLKDAGVPVLWRPLHEAEGAWFWWGAYKGDACKQLYRLMFDIFVKQHKLNNLIWVWTSYAGEKEGNWYPGNDVVDMVVYDYPDQGIFQKFKDLFGDKLMYGIGEVGKLPDPAKFAQEPYSYFLCWDYMILEPGEYDDQKRQGTNPKSWIKTVYSAPTTITLDEVPNYLNTIPIPPPICPVATTCEAESGILEFVQSVSSRTGYSGTGYVEGFTHLDSLKLLRFQVSAPSDGNYQVEIGYASPFGAKSFWLAYPTGSILDTFELTALDFSSLTVSSIPLRAGLNTLGISYGNGYYLIDWIKVTAEKTSAARVQTRSHSPQTKRHHWNLIGQRLKQ